MGIEKRRKIQKCEPDLNYHGIRIESAQKVAQSIQRHAEVDKDHIIIGGDFSFSVFVNAEPYPATRYYCNYQPCGEFDISDK